MAYYNNYPFINQNYPYMNYQQPIQQPIRQGDRMGRYSSERGYSRDDEFMAMYENMPEHKKNELMRIIKEM